MLIAKFILRLITFMIFLFTIGCSRSNNTIVCTVGMVTDIVRQVAGDKQNVEGIIGTGVDPHLYSPMREDVVSLQNAPLVFYSGLHLEGKMTDLFDKLNKEEQKAIYAVTSSIPKEKLLAPPEFESQYDPHVWMDIILWMQAVNFVRETLIRFDPKHETIYKKNSERYLRKLEELDVYARKSLNSIPVSKRVMITAHDAFNYFGRVYDFEVIGIQGISTDSEAGLKRVNDLVKFLVIRQIPVVFVESSVSDKNVRALIEGAEAKGHTVKIGGSLFSDAMGEPGTYEGTYIGMIDHNVTTITRALGGKAPRRGMQGKLKGRGL